MNNRRLVQRLLPALLVLEVTHLSCAGQEPVPEGPRVLSPLTGLAPTSAERDSFSGHRPDSIECSDLAGWYMEEGQLEVDTGACNYLSLVEPAALDAPAGTGVTTEISYFDLTSSEPAVAHVALLANGVVMWERMIPVPAAADVLSLSFDLPVDVAVGDPIEFHLHNHGQNTWNLSPIQLAEQ
jgi:hypothetical protein